MLLDIFLNKLYNFFHFWNIRIQNTCDVFYIEFSEHIQIDYIGSLYEQILVNGFDPLSVFLDFKEVLVFEFE